ncbi:hypothetical protein N7490_003280 [Penicillium lividum]|nr:hypothetical protein N7490_003280 [Penicillium lividum]
MLIHLSEVVSVYDANCDPDEPTFAGCSWETVLQTLEEAKEDYKSRAHHGSSVIMGMDLASQLTDALPEELGLGVIKGVLGIVFEVDIFVGFLFF